MTDRDEGAEVSATGCGGGGGSAGRGAGAGGPAGRGAGAGPGGRRAEVEAGGWRAEAALLPFPSRRVPRDAVGEAAPDVSRWGGFAPGKTGVSSFLTR